DQRHGLVTQDKVGLHQIRSSQWTASGQTPASCHPNDVDALGDGISPNLGAWTTFHDKIRVLYDRAALDRPSDGRNFDSRSSAAKKPKHSPLCGAGGNFDYRIKACAARVVVDLRDSRLAGRRWIDVDSTHIVPKIDDNILAVAEIESCRQCP